MRKFYDRYEGSDGRAHAVIRQSSHHPPPSGKLSSYEGLSANCTIHRYAGGDNGATLPIV